MIRPLLALALPAALACAPLAAAQDMGPPAPEPTQTPPPAQAVPGDAGVAASAPVPNPPPSTDAASPNSQADTGYTGDAYGAAFRDIDARIAALQPRVASNRKAASALNAVKGEEKVRRARHGGELRDFDRELLNKRLDAVAAMVGG